MIGLIRTRLGNFLQSQWLRWKRISFWTRALTLSIFVYGVTFSVLTALRVLALSAFAYDLGVYHQSIYTTLFDRRFFFYTVDLPANPDGSIFGAHFTPILILLLFPYAIVPSLYTLTVVQTWAIALAAVPLYRLARGLLGSERLAFALALAYLLHPATQGVNWYDFHPQAFLPLAFLAALYFLEVKEWRYFVVSMVIALSTIEMAAFIVAVVSAGSLISSWSSARRVGERLDRKTAYVLLGVFLLSVLWAGVGRLVVLISNPHNVYYAGGSGYWNVLGASGLLDVPIQVFLSPGRALAALEFDAPLKLWYIVVLFAPVLFVPFRSLRSLLFCAPWLTVSLFSNQFPLYVVGDQYPSFVLPFVFYGAIAGLTSPWKIPRSVGTLMSRFWPKTVRRIGHGRETKAVALVASSFALLLVVSPLGPLGVGVYRVGGLPVIGYHENAVGLLYGLIPRHASVLTQNNLFPLVSDRSNAFTVPLDNFFAGGASFNMTMDSLTNRVDYILADFQTRPVDAALLYAWANRSKVFGLLGAGDGAILLKRGPAMLSLFTPLLRSYSDGSVLVQNGSYFADGAAGGGFALRHTGTAISEFWFGPFVSLTPGAYEVSYRFRVENPGLARTARLPVVLYPYALMGTILEFPGRGVRTGFDLRPKESKLTLASFDLVARDLAPSGEYFWLTRSFNTTTLGVFEFPGSDVDGGQGLWLDEIRIEQTVPFGFGDIPITWVIRQ